MLSVAVSDPSAVGQVRREADRLARLAGLDEEALARLALVCTEAAENVLRHGGGGEVLLGARTLGGAPGVELVALDRGPGIPDLETALADGHSSADHAGYGLGTVRRQSDHFDVHSAPGTGTALLARVAVREHPGSTRRVVPRPDGPLEVGAIRVARRGERCCGDAWRVRPAPGRCALCVVDGLGHGEGAADAALAALAALAAFDDCDDPCPLARLDAVSEGLRGTRGAVGAVILARLVDGLVGLEHAGVGNVAASVHAPGERGRRFHAIEGTLGRVAPRTRIGRARLGERDLLIVHSDGVRVPDVLERRGGLARRDPTLVAAVLYRDGANREDDCLVLVARAA